MGINGLLPLLKSIHSEVNVEKYKGKTVAIDTYCWLHKAVYSCSYELCLGRPTRRYIDYCLKKVQFLLSLGVTPIMVFDGARLPQKAAEEKSRRESRARNKQKGLSLVGKGKTKEAVKHFQRAVDITPAMASSLINELKPLGVKCIVAPYEADAQLAYLSLTGRADCVISEDSDLLVFGCARVLFKMDAQGNGTEIGIEDFCDVSCLNFKDWNQTMFQEMCILSGCDYLSSINGIGLKKSFAVIDHYRSSEKAIRHLRQHGKYDVPAGYEEDFQRALETFRHQLVFDDIEGKQKNLKTLPSYMFKKDLSFLGRRLEQSLAIKVAAGEIDPNSLQTLGDVGKTSMNVAQRGAAREKREAERKLGSQNLLSDISNYFAKISPKKSKAVKDTPSKRSDKIGIKRKAEDENPAKEAQVACFGLTTETEMIKNTALGKSRFVSARRLSTRRNYGGINFKIDVLEGVNRSNS